MTTYKHFKEKGFIQLQKDLGKKNIHQVPRLDKVIVSIGIGSLATRKGQKDFSEFERNLALITGQKPVMIKAKQSISNFKLREGMPSMLKVTLRKEKAYDFIDRLNKIVLPRVRDFSGISPRSFDMNANYNLGIQNYAIFPELGLDDISIPTGLQITMVFTSSDKEDVKKYMSALGFVFQEK